MFTMSIVPRVFSSRCFTPASSQGIIFRGFARAYSSVSSDGGDEPTKAGISSLLSSLKQKDKNIELKDLLQRGKSVKDPSQESAESIKVIENDVKAAPEENNIQRVKEAHFRSLSPPDHDVRALTGEESRKSHNHFDPRNKTSDISDTMRKMFKSDTENLPVTPNTHDKLKSILSKLKVDSNQANLSKDIVGAARSWGRVTPRYRKDIVSDFTMQTQVDSSKVSRVISLSKGLRFTAFDDVFDNKVPLAKPPSELSLLESVEMEMLEKQESLDQRNDFISLIEISDKQWKFPVDNEVCKVEEESVSFESHVFLGYLLDEFPKKGPVRRFMELVVNGLEQNPHMTLGQKEQQVKWFKDYFDNVPEEDLSF